MFLSSHPDQLFLAVFVLLIGKLEISLKLSLNDHLVGYFILFWDALPLVRW